MAGALVEAQPIRVSKAFTKEDELPEAPLPVYLPGLEPGELRLVTPEGHRALGEELARLDPTSRRAQQLAAALPLLTVKAAASGDRVGFGSWVVATDEAGARHVWRIVGPDEVDARQGRISQASPLARALLGKGAGDEAVVELPQRTAEYTVVSVSDTAP